MSKRLKIGVLGAANIATRSVIPALLGLPDIYEFIGIATRDINTCEELANKFSCKIFDGYDSILDKETIDAIYIPLPNSLHYEWVKKSLQQGIHVLVEKSLAMNLEQVSELAALSNNLELALVENFQFRFHNQLSILKKLLDDNTIGEFKYMRSSFEFPPFPDKLNIRYNQKLGGGALYDAGAYPIKISNFFLGEDVGVKASSLYFDEKLGVDISGGAFLEQKSTNRFSEITFGFDNYYRCNIQLFGSMGMISTDRVFTAPPGFDVVITVQLTGRETEYIKVQPCNHFKKMLIHFQEVVFNNELLSEENRGNINQSKLLQDLYEQSK